MRVNPNSGPSQVTDIPGRTAPPGPRLEQDKLALEGADALNQSLRQTPDVRPDKVEYAQRLVADPSYPCAAIVKSVAGVIAGNISGPASPDNTT